MKILISTVLLTIAVFLRFDELNATDPGEGSSTGERRVTGRPRGSRINQDKFRVADPKDGPADRTVHYRGIEIKVWMDNRVKVRKAIYKANYIPQAAYYSFHNFLIRTMDLDGVRLVAYVNCQGGLIGVRGPRRTGQYYTQEPTATEWYINYSATHFKVAVINSAPIGITLMPENVHVLGEHSFKLVNVAGIRFKVFKGGPLGKITGAELESSYSIV